MVKYKKKFQGKRKSNERWRDTLKVIENQNNKEKERKKYKLLIFLFQVIIFVIILLGKIILLLLSSIFRFSIFICNINIS